MRPRGYMLLLGLFLLAGCRSWKEPVPLDQIGSRDRSMTAEQDGIRVTVWVPDRKKTKALFGTSLYDSRIQPVWVEIDNSTHKEYILIKNSIDRDYFSSLEVAWKRKTGRQKTRKRMQEFFFTMDFPNPVGPGETVSGFVFTNLEEGFKAVPVDLISSNDMISMSFIVEVPGLVTDYTQREFEDIYDSFTDLETEDALRSMLAGLPAATTNRKGNQSGDPLNIVFIGSNDHVFSALIHCEWHVTEVTYAASSWKSIKSFLFGSRYLYAPISSLYVFGRSQDMGLQKARHSINSRNHMRLWLTPYTYRGDPVWLGQISRDIGVRTSKRTLLTHAIDPDIDETRNGLIGDLAYSQRLTAIGFSSGSVRSTLENPESNLTPEPYYSDGLRAVMFFDERPRSLDEIHLLDWEEPIRNKDRIKVLQEFLSTSE